MNIRYIQWKYGMYIANTAIACPMKTKSVLRTAGASHPGFALVVTISALILVFVIVMGLLGLSTTSVRAGQLELARQEARANARFALVIAIGELQRELGPDQRISASAGILDRKPETLPVDGVEQPHWIGVWATEWLGETGDKDNKSPWVRNDEEGGLRDRRFAEGYDREKEVRNYLVSGNEGGRAQLGANLLDAIDARFEDGIRLVSSGSVLNRDEEVSAPRVATRRGGRRTGSYSFWIGDLGAKAPAGLIDHFAADAPRRGAGAEGMERLLNAQDAQEEMVTGLGEVEESEARRLVSDSTLGLAEKIDGTEVKRAFHHSTIWSKAVLANVRQPGLQRDLTAYLNTGREFDDLLEGGKILSAGLRGSDKMVGPANPRMASEQGTTWQETKYRDIAPTFRLLLEWSRIGSRLPWDEECRRMISPAPVRDSSMLRGMNDGVNVYDGANTRPASFLPLDRTNLYPVMVEGSLFYNLASYPEEPREPDSEHVLRICYYPRVALWNPYSIDIKTPPLAATIFVNGNKEVQIRDADGGRHAVPIPFGRGSTKVGAVNSAVDRSPGHYVGWVLFKIDPVTIPAGETMVFSSASTKQYDIADVHLNLLSPTVAPDPALYFWQDMEEKHPVRPQSFVEFPGPGNQSGGDNYLMSLKDASSVNGMVTDANFDNLQSIIYANCSLQAGGSDELPVQWAANNPVPVYPLRGTRDRLPGDAIPDVRTRDGFRLRWWHEHRSNLLGSGQLRNSPQHFQTSLLGTWNPRAAYFCRTPWDNVSDLPPHFFGMYTRDLFDSRVSWQAMMPRPKDGRQIGYPFGAPLDGQDKVVLFEVPRVETGIPSIGYLRHLKLSEFGWHPSYPVGNSLVDPRVGRTTTSPLLRSSREKANHGWNQYLFGWDNERDSGRGPDYWAMLFRQILFERPTDHFVVYDQCYELNFNFWDNYFVSTGDAAHKAQFVSDPDRHPLPNGRMDLYPSGQTVREDLNDLHRAAYQLLLDGGFNVHSISKEAWKAILTSTMDTGYGTPEAVPFPRTLNAPEGEWMEAGPEDKEALAGFRSLTEYELDRLAEELVREVKERAPFFGLSDFINRRLVDSEHGDKGPIEAAISAAGINTGWDDGPLAINNEEDLPRVTFDNMQDSTRLDCSLKPDSVAWGIPGYLTQGDVVQVIGSSLRPRSDSFVVRGYGESVNAVGEVVAQAWCEAIVQRTPEPVHPDASGLNPLLKDDEEFIDFGRRFKMVNFKWLASDEV